MRVRVASDESEVEVEVEGPNLKDSFKDRM